MKSRTAILLTCVLLFIGERLSSALDFNVDISSYNYSNSIVSYGVSVHLDADFSDFDELVDGFVVTSPDGTFSLSVSTESFSASQGFLFPNFPAATAAIYGEWTLEQTVIGLPFDSQTFRVSSAGLSVADYRPAQITSPSFRATGVSPQQIITFAGPAGATQIGIGLSPETGTYPNGGFAFLTANASQHTPPFQLSAGLNKVYVIYYLPAGEPEKVAIESPSDVAWNAVFSRACLAFSEFTVDGSELRLLGLERVGAQFRWSFASEAGRTYDVLYKDDLNSATWLTLQTINGDGGAKSFTVTPDQSARFFQVMRR